MAHGEVPMRWKGWFLFFLHTSCQRSSIIAQWIQDVHLHGNHHKVYTDANTKSPMMRHPRYLSSVTQYVFAQRFKPKAKLYDLRKSLSAIDQTPNRVWIISYIATSIFSESAESASPQNWFALHLGYSIGNSFAISVEAFANTLRSQWFSIKMSSSTVRRGALRVAIPMHYSQRYATEFIAQLKTWVFWIGLVCPCANKRYKKTYRRIKNDD